MLKIQRLKKPSKKSGFELKPGETSSIRGLTVVNRNTFSVYVDKWSRKPNKKSKKK